MKPGKFQGGGMNMGNLMKQAQKMQADMAKLQEELSLREYTESAGGNMVTATVRGTSELIGLEIKPEAVDPDDIEMLSDMIIAAVNAVLKKAADESSAEMSKITGGMPF